MIPERKYPPIAQSQPEQKNPDPVARSVARPDAFSKPGSMGTNARGMRFRPLHVKGRRPGRKRKPDPRYVRFY